MRRVSPLLASNADLRCVGMHAHFAKRLVHHCCSQGTPSWSPSIWTLGQFRRKKVASSQEVICEQWVRPSQRKDEDDGCSLDGAPATA